MRSTGPGDEMVIECTPSYSVQDDLWYFYHVAPIDWLWNSLLTPEIAETILAHDDVAEDYGLEDEQEGQAEVEPHEMITCESDEQADAGPVESFAAQKFRRDLEAAKGFAKHAGWEGDFVRGPRVFWLPDPDSMTFRYAFAWKQQNNGSTFVVSPLPLAWLGKAKTCRH